MQSDNADTHGNGKKKAGDDGRIGRLRSQMYSRLRQPRQRPRRTLKEDAHSVPVDWQRAEERDEVPNKTPKHRMARMPSYSWPTIFLVVAVAIFMIAGGVAAWFVLSGSNVVSARDIDILIRGPRTVEGGVPIELQIEVRNNNSATLELAELIVTYPEQTLMESGFRRNAQTNAIEQTISLGAIEPGGSRSGVVRATLLGKENTRYDIGAALEYRLANSSAVFFDEEKYSVLLSSDAVELVVQSQEEAIAGQQYALTVSVTSRADTALSNVTLHPSYPFGFSVEDSIPEAEQDGSWKLGALEPGETRDVVIVGTLEGETEDERVFRFVARRSDPFDEKDASVALVDAEQRVRIERPFLAMGLEFDDRTAQEYIARPGESIPVRLNWQNNLSVPLSNVVIAATLGGEGLNPFTVSVDQGFYRSIDSIVLWDKTTTRGALELIPASANGVVSMNIVPQITDELLAIENPTITLELHASGNRLSEEGVPELIQSTVREEIKIETDTAFRAEALYFENPLGSVGPLPPKVQHETTYGILWELSNSTNLVRDARVTATIPPYVRWRNVVSPSAERVTFNERDGTITWHVGRLLPDTGVGSKAPRRVIFSIGLVPSASQVGQQPDLLLEQTLRGIDDFTGTEIEEIINPVSTDLDEADFADVYGRVVR